MCTTHGHQSNLLKCSTGLHVHQRDLHSHTAVIKLSPVTLHVDIGFLLFAGPSSKVTKDMILSSSSFLFQVICSPASHDVVFCNVCFPDEISSCNDLLHFCLLPNSSTVVEFDWYWLLGGLNTSHLLERLCLHGVNTLKWGTSTGTASEIHLITLYLSQLQAKSENTADQCEQKSNAHDYFLSSFLSTNERCLCQ